MNILIFFIFLTTKININVLIESHSKFKCLKYEILKFKKFIKS
jgi:hypothetical protein